MSEQSRIEAESLRSAILALVVIHAPQKVSQAVDALLVGRDLIELRAIVETLRFIWLTLPEIELDSNL